MNFSEYNMSKATETLYKSNPVNHKRLATDKLFLDASDVKFSGMLDDAVRFTEKKQLLDRAHWKRFVDQFRFQDDGENRGWRGEYWGKMMRGGAFVYSYTKNEELYQVLTETVCDMLTCAEPDGRVSTYSRATEFGGWDIWCRKYVLLGMQYYLEICRDDELRQKIVSFMCGSLDYLIERIGNEPGKRNITSCSGCWRGLNASTILEPTVRLYDITGDKKYLDFAAYIISEGGVSTGNIFKLAEEDIAYPYEYPVTKAYEMMSLFEGIIEYYRATGDEKYRKIAINFAKRIAESDITIIGTAGCSHELLDHSLVHQADPFYFDDVKQETCVTVTWMKYCMQLLAMTGDPFFADCFEISLYNAYLGSYNTEGKVSPSVAERFPDYIEEILPFDSYSSLLPDTRGRQTGGIQLMRDRHVYGCCACIASAGAGMVGKVAMTLDETGAAINLYSRGVYETRTPEGKKVRISLDTDYPADGVVKLRFLDSTNGNFSLKLRIPAWSKETTLSIGNDTHSVSSGYAELTRDFAAGDEITLTLDMRAQVIHPVSCPRDIVNTDMQWDLDILVHRVVLESPETKYHIAIRRGPLILARDARLGSDVKKPVDIDYDSEGYVKLTPSSVAKFPYIVCFSVPKTDGGSFTVVDYSSSGKTWDKRSEYACWLPTKH